MNDKFENQFILIMNERSIIKFFPIFDEPYHKFDFLTNDDFVFDTMNALGVIRKEHSLYLSKSRKVKAGKINSRFLGKL